MIHPRNNLDRYDYSLPQELIAQKPVEPRDSARLLVIHRKKGIWEHRSFLDFSEYFDQNDLLVVNNTRVLKARLLGFRLKFCEGEVLPGGKVEFVLLRELRPRVWEGLFRASAKSKRGFQFYFSTPDGKGLNGVLLSGSDESPTGIVVAEFDQDPILSGAGETPLPPYIERAPVFQDEVDYQTVYAKKLGSVAAPTAGLHFSARVIEHLKKKGVSWEEITLHVGLGTFRPVKESDISQHRMHEEHYEISEKVAHKITHWKNSGHRILGVGTTTVRTLESAWHPKKIREGSFTEGPFLKAGQGQTSLFIWPGCQPEGFQFQVVDRLLTNFHLPKSTLLMLVSAFAGEELILSAYREAIQKKYRFFSYGDAMLILE